MTDDPEVSFYQEKFYIECLKLYARLPNKEKLRIDTVIMDIYIRMKTSDPDNIKLSFYDILIVIVSSMYLCKFNESPVQTAIFSRQISTYQPQGDTIV